MTGYKPWYEKLSLLQMVCLGFLGGVLFVVIKDYQHLSVLLDPTGSGLRFYAIVGGMFGSGIIGMLAGWWGYRRLNR